MKIKFIDRMNYRDHPTQGWYLWAYPDNHAEYVAWMQEHMTDYYVANIRFNSGSPMVETFITGEADYAVFKLVWGSK